MIYKKGENMNDIKGNGWQTWEQRTRATKRKPTNMANNPRISIVTLNVSGLNAPVLRDYKWIKK